MSSSSIDFVIYHAGCRDGFGSAYAAWTVLGDDPRVTYYAAQHGTPPPDVRGRHVAIFDFSYPRSDIETMRAAAASFVLLDHHKTAFEMLSDVPGCTFDMSKSGARLAWEFFHPADPMPEFLAYIEDRDLWRWALPDSREFSAGFALVPMTWTAYDEFRRDPDIAVARCKEHGRVLLEADRHQISRLASKHVQRSLSPWGRVAVVNSPVLISELGEELARVPGVDFALVWYYDHPDRSTRCSLRSVGDFDVSVIARHYGGGGHRNASGFCLGPRRHIEDLFDTAEQSKN